LRQKRLVNLGAGLAVLCVTAVVTLGCTRYYNSHYAGYGAHQFSDTNQWVGVQGDFAQPAFGNTPCSGSAEGSWVGVGGTTALMQAGTSITGTQSSPAYRAFVEYLNDQGQGILPIYLTEVTVVPTHNIHAFVAYSVSNKRGDFLVYNTTNGTFKNLSLYFADDRYYDGTIVHWIDERPLGPSDFVPLVNFGQVSWHNVQAWANDNTWYPLGATDYGSYGMWKGTSGGGRGTPTPPLLALPVADLASGTPSFTDKWNYC